ncbi:MAG TPA: 3-hydroxybutyryl-CoA dehydrogenase [Candidatus Methylomirabilis sp.]|jgi:3-hydroxybutyryl-CoA dehydrogenase|nr:3-hydroxybutyryl-CoA dehydrogenase [Candidatus Methylomirabilis sp.]
MEIQTLGIVGAGTMGSGIAQVALQAGYGVLLRDVSEGILEAARGRIGAGLSKGVEKGKFSAADREGMLGRLKTTTAIADLAHADFVVEAATESFEIKRGLFLELDRLARPETILASNTSSISITKIAGVTKRPDRVVGMHFFNPVPLMALVEVIRGLQTSDTTATATIELAKRLGKTPVEANDFPGFIANRILVPMINEAIYALMEGVGTAEAIDNVMRLGANHPMGPLALADLIGLDVCLAVLKVLHEELGDDKYRPCPLLVKMVDAGYLGRKTGRGFHTY